MDLLLNDLSLHGQFLDTTTFKEAVSRIMSMRRIAISSGFQLHSPKDILNRPATPTTSLNQALQRLSKDQKRSVLQWLTRYGPFWEDLALHDSDLYMDYRGEIVTEMAVGEAAYCTSIGISRALISFAPSDWQLTPVRVRVVSEATTEVTVRNYWEVSGLEAALKEARPPVTSWEQMERLSRREFQRLTFSAECFSKLSGQPFGPGVAVRILARLRILDDLVGSVDVGGQRTPEGHRIYQEHFTGARAWFSDSSETEKRQFEKELTFIGPDGNPLFCTWHGKLNNPPYRIHFAWPVSHRAPLYIAYIGLKITRR